ncbi:MAG: hypothetical protein Q9221_008030 [Calogaya cf. arnoldii]
MLAVRNWTGMSLNYPRTRGISVQEEAESRTSKVPHHKMKGYYHRYALERMTETQERAFFVGNLASMETNLVGATTIRKSRPNSKKKGDYHRYLAKFAFGEKHKGAYSLMRVLLRSGKSAAQVNICCRMRPLLHPIQDSVIDLHHHIDSAGLFYRYHSVHTGRPSTFDEGDSAETRTLADHTFMLADAWTIIYIAILLALLDKGLFGRHIWDTKREDLTNTPFLLTLVLGHWAWLKEEPEDENPLGLSRAPPLKAGSRLWGTLRPKTLRKGPALRSLQRRSGHGSPLVRQPSPNNQRPRNPAGQGHNTYGNHLTLPINGTSGTESDERPPERNPEKYSSNLQKRGEVLHAICLQHASSEASTLVDSTKASGYQEVNTAIAPPKPQRNQLTDPGLLGKGMAIATAPPLK